LASYGEGSVERAREIADPALWQFRAALLHDLSSAAPNPVRMAKSIQTFVDEAGKEASERRVRLRTVVAFAEEFFRAQMRTEAGGNPGGDELLQTSLAKAAKNQTVFLPLDALEACLSAVENVDRNANLGLVIQRWCEELTGGRVAV
jgi:DNA polymerase III subunit delta'